MLHVIESAYYAEVIDPATGQPAAARPDRRTGSDHARPHRLAAAALSHRRPGAAPKPSPAPAAAHDLALPGGILGRTDDMVVVRGVNVYPGAVEEIIRATGGVAEYRVRVSTARPWPNSACKSSPRPAIPMSAALVGELEKQFHTQFALRVPVTAVPPGTLPRFEMKAQRWVRE